VSRHDTDLLRAAVAVLLALALVAAANAALDRCDAAAEHAADARGAR
jgi:hypothetical protein